MRCYKSHLLFILQLGWRGFWYKMPNDAKQTYKDVFYPTSFLIYYFDTIKLISFNNKIAARSIFAVFMIPTKKNLQAYVFSILPNPTTSRSCLRQSEACCMPDAEVISCRAVKIAFAALSLFLTSYTSHISVF